MADRKISDLTALTTPASGDYVPIVDISEAAAASKNKRVTIQSLFQGIPVNVGIGTTAPSSSLDVVGALGIEVTNTQANNSSKSGRYTTTHYNTAEEPICIAVGSANASESQVRIGGGTSNLNAATSVEFYTAANTTTVTGTERARIDSSGNVGIGTSSPTTLLDVNADTVRVRTARTPASATATGATGEICWDANYIYVCTATNTWKRAALSTW